MTKKLSALALLVAASLSGCAARHAAPAPDVPKTVTAPAETGVLKRELADGLYEMVLNQKGDALFVASAEGFKDVQGGVIYKLDPTTLKTIGRSHTDLKNFAMTLSPDGHTLYVTNSLDGGISAINTADGKIKKRLMFTERNKEGFPFGAREILLHEGTLYVGGVGDPGVIWVVDAETLKLKKTIKNAGQWVTGLLWSEQTDRLYAANGGGEILVINPHGNKIEKRWKPLGDKPALLLNLAEDNATGRLFVTDNSKAKTTLVLNIHTGEVIKQLDVGDSLAVKFNAKRNELYITQRESGKLLSLDATSYAVKQTWDLPPNPNSLLLSADGQTLYVTVKQAFNKDHSTNGPDSVVRIALN
ncbi:SMP-30/gluconolactonase/LRE family protein [Enterobacter wuhouensis]|uniref:SMP-30/gluconolactonase/LRE family protein n=1 Tax=Enterobacter wuhouensis TaxID=2529381 RepID=A0ABZ1DJD9_9ENTR|nr:SMP-30/gluconolactonase/LRE family protein [Enterobacter wuhouensis]WRW32663.1 SMP-30/gluconolactonase/LRE family protein [Enterobacter wuhouensis]